MEPVQICLNSPESIAAIVGMVVTGTSAVANFIPAPDKLNNKVMRAISRIVHFVAADVVTAAKSK